jgi:hypothetical protein
MKSRRRSHRLDSRGLSSLLSRESLTSLQGAAAVTLLVPNVLAYLFGVEFRAYEKWVGLVVAVVIGFVVTQRPRSVDWTWWVVALLNGLLIYSAAVGLTTMLGVAVDPGGMATMAEGTGGRLPFFHSWYP